MFVYDDMLLRPLDLPLNLMDAPLQILAWALRLLGSTTSAPLWAWLLLFGVFFAGGLFVGSVLPLSLFSENRFVQVAKCYAVLYTLEGGVLYDGERIASAATSFWQIGAAAVERFHR